MKLAIIGTAGRKEDGRKLTLEVWNDMKRVVAKFVKVHGADHVVSGSAAYADHLAVGLYLAGLVSELTLHLPCTFDVESATFEDNGVEFSFLNPGPTSTFYHEHFSRTVGIDSLRQIAQAIQKGAHVSAGGGFKARNTLIAQEADAVLAFTFGEGALLKDGGSADTMRKYLDIGGKNSYHVDLNTMTLHSPALVP